MVPLLSGAEEEFDEDTATTRIEDKQVDEKENSIKVEWYGVEVT